MVLMILMVIAIVIGGYFAFRYILLIYAMRTIKRDIDVLQKDLTQNQILHLPTPNRQLKELLCSFNCTLDEIRKERQQYERREREFQSQIENISHDLRTPLTVILGYLKIFKKSHSTQLSTDEELSNAINIVEQKAEVMKNLVEQFYIYSRLKTNNYELMLEKIDVARTLRESLMGNYQILEQAHLNVEIDIPERPIWVFAEQSTLERIFLNMFQNAGRYADTLFQITIQEEPNEIVISFSNDTCMLSEKDLPYVFDRFYMQDDARNQGGSGLGLTVAQSLAEEMKGALDVKIQEDSKIEENTKIMIRFELTLQSM